MNSLGVSIPSTHTEMTSCSGPMSSSRCNSLSVSKEYFALLPKNRGHPCNTVKLHNSRRHISEHTSLRVVNALSQSNSGKHDSQDASSTDNERPEKDGILDPRPASVAVNHLESQFRVGRGKPNKKSERFSRALPGPSDVAGHVARVEQALAARLGPAKGSWLEDSGKGRSQQEAKGALALYIKRNIRQYEEINHPGTIVVRSDSFVFPIMLQEF